MNLADELDDAVLGLGTAGFAFGGASDDEAVDRIRLALALGAGVIDTARAYAREGEQATAERMVRLARADGAGDGALLLTKGGHERGVSGFPVDGSPATLRRHCLESRRRLGVDRIDCYLLHHPDPTVPIEESVAELESLRADGVVRWIGLSNVSRDQLARARGAGRIDAVQNRLSLTAPDHLGLAHECAAASIAFFAYSPLGGGGTTVLPSVVEIARRVGVSSARVQLAWMRARAPRVVPILGSTRSETIRDAFGTPPIVLTPEDLRALDARG